MVQRRDNFDGRDRQETDGETIEGYCGRNVVKEMGIKDLTWLGGPNDITWTSSMLHLRPIDMLKNGQLLLDGCQLDGKSVASSDSIKKSTGIQVSPPNSEVHYGYQWWHFEDSQPVVKDLEKNDLYFGWGTHGQFLLVIPHLELVEESSAAKPWESHTGLACV